MGACDIFVRRKLSITVLVKTVIKSGCCDIFVVVIIDIGNSFLYLGFVC